jgi:hypothetical protein
MSPRDDLDAIAAHILQPLSRVTANERERHSWRIIHNAQMTCAQCARCGSVLTADAPVWRDYFKQGRGVFGGTQWTVAPVCERCRSKWREYRDPRPCENCGRNVHQQNNLRSHRRTFCCEDCKKVVSIAAARRRRADARGARRCETFEPPRADGRFCSSACRQRAYRRRRAATDDKSVSCVACVSRNADALESEAS